MAISKNNIFFYKTSAMHKTIQQPTEEPNFSRRVLFTQEINQRKTAGQK